MAQQGHPHNGRVPREGLPGGAAPEGADAAGGAPVAPPPPAAPVAPAPPDPRSGLALALTWLTLAGFLHARPDYLGSPGAALVASVVLGCFGITGLSAAIHRLEGAARPPGRSNPGVGLLLGAAWALVYANAPFWWVNLLTAPLLALACYGTALGLITSLALAFRPGPSRRAVAAKLLLAALQLAACAAVVLVVLGRLGLAG